MPPFHKRSTGARRTAWTSSSVDSSSASMPSTARASRDNGTDRPDLGKTPPPREISSGS